MFREGRINPGKIQLGTIDIRPPARSGIRRRSDFNQAEEEE